MVRSKGIWYGPAVPGGDVRARAVHDGHRAGVLRELRPAREMREAPVVGVVLVLVLGAREEGDFASQGLRERVQRSGSDGRPAVDRARLVPSDLHAETKTASTNSSSAATAAVGPNVAAFAGMGNAYPFGPPGFTAPPR